MAFSSGLKLYAISLLTFFRSAVMRQSRSRILGMLLALLFTNGAASESSYEGKKILYINSYHIGYEGSDPITESIQGVLKNYPIELKIVYMDTKRNSSEEFSKAAALKARAVIEEFRPDVVIASDDNASKYLIMAYYKDAELPFIFCGVNWDASVYGFPYKNVTGMIEVALVSEIFRHLKKYAKGDRIGFIAGDTLSERKNLEYYIKRFNIQFNRIYFATTFDEWKQSYLKLQDEVDMAMMTSHVGIANWDDAEARAFAEQYVKIPIGTEHRWSIPFALVSVAKDFEEMGAWSAHAALKILDGVPPSRIPITANQKGHLLFNARIAERLEINGVPALAEIVR